MKPRCEASITLDPIERAWGRYICGMDFEDWMLDTMGVIQSVLFWELQIEKSVLGSENEINLSKIFSMNFYISYN